jgi:hypothetical protein
LSTDLVEHKLIDEILTHFFCDMTLVVSGRLVQCSIWLRLHAKHDSEFLLTVIPELYQPVKGRTIDIFDVISKYERNVPLLGRLSNTRMYTQETAVSIVAGRFLVKRLQPILIREPRHLLIRYHQET